MSKTTTKTSPLASAEFRFTLDLPAAPGRAWTALTKEIQSWWPADFHALGPQSRIILEP